MGQSKSHSVNRRAFLAGTTAIGTVAALPAGFGSQALASDDTLRAAITGYSVLNTFDPAKSTLIQEGYVYWGIFNALAKFNENMEIVPDLAESWENPDPNTWIFHLREGVKFHNGEELTADDVKFTLDRVRDEQLDSPHRAKFDVVEEVEAVDQHTVRIRTSEPSASLLTYLTNSRTGSQIVSRKAVEELGDREFKQNPVGTGPYRFVDYRAGERVRLEAHEEYFDDGVPHIREVAMPLIEDEAAATSAVLAGDIDITATLPFADVPSLREEQGASVLTTRGLNVRYVALNNQRAPFDDVHFRRAVSMAVDREQIVRAVLFGEGEAANGFIPRALSWAHEPELFSTAVFDPEAAREELEKSQYGPGQTGRILTWSGWWRRFAEVFVAQANEHLGTNLEIEVTEPGAATTRLREGDYEAVVWGWLGLIDPDEYLRENFHSEGPRNDYGYSNQEFDELVEAATRELDPGRRGQMYRDADRMFAEDVPVIPCFYANIHNLVADRVDGFVQVPYSGFGNLLKDVRFV